MTIELSKPDSRLEAIQFLAKSMLPKDGRFHVGHIKVEANGNAVSTDGARLHFVGDLALEPGYYKIHKLTKSGALIDKAHDLDTREGDFPDYADLLAFPSGNGEQSFSVNLTPDFASKSYTEVVRAMKGSTIEFSFLKDLCNTVQEVVSVVVPGPEETSRGLETCKPIHFGNDNLHAIIMPKVIK